MTIGVARHLLVPAVPARRACARRCSTRKRVVVLEKCLAVGLGGIVSDGVRKALVGHRSCNGYTVIAGLGGRADHARPRCTRLFEDARRATSSSR